MAYGLVVCLMGMVQCENTLGTVNEEGVAQQTVFTNDVSFIILGEEIGVFRDTNWHHR